MRPIAIAGASVLLLGLAAGSLASLPGTREARSQAQEGNETPAPIPPEDAAKKNPVKAAPGGTASAKKLFGYHCAMCHRVDGDGKGELAEEMKLELKDWRDPNALAKMTDGELFYIVTNGRGKMTGGEGDRTSEEARWNLVNYVRAFAKKDAAAKP